MKKTMILSAFAALLSLSSCQKEITSVNGNEEDVVSTVASPVFTATINPETKTTVNVTDGKIAWEATDVITVTDAAKNSATYSIEGIDATTGKATFVIKDGTLGDGPYTATYGTEPATAQTYSATAGKLYMTAPATSNNSFTFSVQCGLMKLNLTKTGEIVKSIAVTGTPTGGSETTYTLTCTEAQSIASAKDFFIALPAGSYTKIEITNASNNKCTLNSASGVVVATNHIKPVTFGENKIAFRGNMCVSISESCSETVKSDVRFQNNSDKYELIRATVVANWCDNSGNIVAAWDRTRDGDIILGGDWFLNSDGFYYYSYPLAAGLFTGNLFDSFTKPTTAPVADAHFEMTILVQATSTSGGFTVAL